MRAGRLVIFLLSALPLCASSLDQIADRLEQQTGALPASLRIEYRMRAAQALAGRHPELAHKFIDLSLKELQDPAMPGLNPAVYQAFAAVAPEEGAALARKLNPDAVASMTGALARAGKTAEAESLYRWSLAPGDIHPAAGNLILARLVKEQPAEAQKLFGDMLARAHFDTLDPIQAYHLLDCAKTISSVAPALAAQTAEGIALAAAHEDYGSDGSTITATFQAGSETITTANARETLLVASGARLKAWAPDWFAAHKELFARWNLNGPLTVKGLGFGSAGAQPRQPAGDAAAINKQIGQLRGLPSDADRGRSVLHIVAAIRELPTPVERLNMISSVANLATEGDLGKEALTAVAETFAEALREARRTTGEGYLQLASLVRFEHLPTPKPDPALEAAGTLIDLQEQIHQEAGFTLTALDGKTYSLAALRGHVVLLNFWATWCPPCRKEMPDMEKLYQRLESKGLIVLAVSDEDRDTVAGFEQKQKYSFPILLDPDRKVNTAFDVEGIPKSFLFDREGKLVAKAIDMRTESQFVEMLKAAGM